MHQSAGLFGHLSPAVLIFVVCLGALFIALKAKSGPPAPVAKEFMTQREKAMLEALEHVLPMYRIHAQVAMGALLAVPQQFGRKSSPADRNRFSQKIVDFVVVDPTAGKVVVLVELDDRSHTPAKDRERDAMTAKAGYKTIRIPASARPSMHTAIQAVGHLRDADAIDG